MNTVLKAMENVDKESRELSSTTGLRSPEQERAVVDVLKKLVEADQAKVREAMQKVIAANERISRYDAAIKTMELGG